MAAAGSPVPARRSGPAGHGRTVAHSSGSWLGVHAAVGEGRGDQPGAGPPGGSPSWASFAQGEQPAPRRHHRGGPGGQQQQGSAGGQQQGSASSSFALCQPPPCAPQPHTTPTSTSSLSTSSSWQMNLAVNLGSHLKRECSSMTIFVLSWEEIKIELSKNLSRSFISDLIGLNILVPG